MRRALSTAVPVLLALLGGSPASALEHVSARMPDPERSDAWNAGATCTLQYYNICTGWIWIFSGLGGRDRIGVCYDTCCEGSATLLSSWMYVSSGSPTGYGFTGTISVSAVDANCCPAGLPLATQAFLPVTGWNPHIWSAQVPASFLIQAEFGPSYGNPVGIVADHPAAAAGGPPACGTCYPTTRGNHSYYYGIGGQDELCPPRVMWNDGVCDVQFLWDCDLICPVSVEPRSWGSIKSLYR